jgi:hypothetical protein
LSFINCPQRRPTTGLAAVGGQVQNLIFTYLSASVVIQQQFFKYRPTAKPKPLSAMLERPREGGLKIAYKGGYTFFN